MVHPTLSKNPEFFSHKSNGPGLAYELALDLYDSTLVWLSGPFKAGCSDKKIYKHPGGLRSMIPKGKKVVADGGYANKKWLEMASPNSRDPELLSTFKARAKMRQENFHSKIKVFNALSGNFRHSIERHKVCFEAACVIAQYDNELCNPLLDV